MHRGDPPGRRGRLPGAVAEIPRWRFARGPQARQLGLRPPRRAGGPDGRRTSPYPFQKRSLSAFETTDTELMAMAAPAIMGESVGPPKACSTPAATGMPSTL